jgi:predicted NAD/FAD-binding protein
MDRLPRRKRIAVVGAGIAGLASAWLLDRQYEVSLFEAADYAGGHTHTVDVAVDGASFPVDTGFLVFNRQTYPNLCALFALLDVPVAESAMSFAVSLAAPDLEWAGTDLGSVFAQRRNLLRLAFWGMLRDLLRFNRQTTRLLEDGHFPVLSLGEFLTVNGYGDAFRDNYLMPMAAAIWSCPTATMRAYPLATFVRFCHNHGLLRILRRPQWYTVKGGGAEYVRRLCAGISDLRLASPVLGVERGAEGVVVVSRHGRERFDEIVFACHSDQTLRILGADASSAEQALLSAVKYQDNVAWLHTDTRLLPRRRGVWAAWNYLAGQGEPGARPVSVSYLLNRLQPLPVTTPVVLSLNPLVEPAAETVLGCFHYAHPVFDQHAIEAQTALAGIQGQRGSWFAGAWAGFGFHEDGLNSALAVAAGLGVRAPWQHAAATERVG